MSSSRSRTMGLDVGERRIGMAIADELGMIASPAGVVQRGEGDLQRILETARAQGADVIVIGLPMGLSGREGPQAATVRAFAESLGTASDDALEIVFWDERLTSTMAERALEAQGRRKNRRSGEIDAMAAAVILQGYLDAERNSFRQRSPHGRDAR
ncbi:MAG: Holliday junction resolvase RuvX [Thermomicrobiales bacterium]